jgi:hypothetical protein
MKYKIDCAIICVLIVLSPILILALHYHNKMESINHANISKYLQFLTTRQPSTEDFAASQGGALQQLMSTRVLSEAEVAQNLRYEKRQVVNDILNMTEPESLPGPRPASR